MPFFPSWNLKKSPLTTSLLLMRNWVCHLHCCHKKSHNIWLLWGVTTINVFWAPSYFSRFILGAFLFLWSICHTFVSRRPNSHIWSLFSLFSYTYLLKCPILLINNRRLKTLQIFLIYTRFWFCMFLCSQMLASRQDLENVWTPITFADVAFSGLMHSKCLLGRL